MTNHPNRPRPRAWITPPADVIRELRARAGITQAQCAEMTRAALRTWEQWERGDRRMPAATMELWCIALAVGTVAHGPYIAPGDWMRPWVRDVLCLSFRSGPRLFFTGGDVPAYTVTTLGLPGGRS